MHSEECKGEQKNSQSYAGTEKNSGCGVLTDGTFHE